MMHLKNVEETFIDFTFIKMIKHKRQNVKVKIQFLDYKYIEKDLIKFFVISLI